MANSQFFDNPDFLKYVRLLKVLHDAIRRGSDESEEGEGIREQMDDPGSQLSPAEISGVNGISADFYSLIDEPPEAILPANAQVQEDLRAASRARDSKDFNGALELLRRNARFIDPALLASRRGEVWSAAGEFEIARLFFERATALNTSSSGQEGAS
jgi:hypothetical protein